MATDAYLNPDKNITNHSARKHLDQKLRSATKYGVIDNKEATPEEQDMADKVREFIRDILNDYNLNLEE